MAYSLASHKFTATASADAVSRRIYPPTLSPSWDATRPTIETYSAHVDRIQRNARPSADLVLETILAREALHTLVTARKQDAQFLLRVSQIDRNLQVSALSIDRALGAVTLRGWREARADPESSWWWRLDEIAEREAHQSHPILAALTLSAIIGAFSLGVYVLHRFFAAGSDFGSLFSGLLQSLLVVIMGSSFTDAGDRGLRRLFGTRPVRSHWIAGAKLAIATVALISVLIVKQWGIPAMGLRTYNEALDAFLNGEVTSAISSYQTAIDLLPDFAPAHYGLANAYEDIAEYEKALSEYKAAISIDRTLVAAHNNIGRLYILHLKEPVKALEWLDTAIALGHSSPSVLYSLHKNRGWAYLELNATELAELDMRRALELGPDKASTHCLLAKLAEQRGPSDESLRFWQSCLAREMDKTAEVEWLFQARLRVLRGGTP